MCMFQRTLVCIGLIADRKFNLYKKNIKKGHFLSLSKHNTNTTELRPKVRQTCYILLSKYSDVVNIFVTLVPFSYDLLQLNKVCCQLTKACTCATK